MGVPHIVLPELYRVIGCEDKADGMKKAGGREWLELQKKKRDW